MTARIPHTLQALRLSLESSAAPRMPGDAGTKASQPPAGSRPQPAAGPPSPGFIGSPVSAAYEAYDAAVTAAKDRGKAAIARRRQLRGALVQVLRELAL